MPEPQPTRLPKDAAQATLLLCSCLSPAYSCSESHSRSCPWPYFGGCTRLDASSCRRLLLAEEDTSIDLPWRAPTLLGA